MKRLFLGITFLSTVLLTAQIDFRNTRFGIIGGYNFSKVQNAHNPSGPRHTLQGGITALIPVDQYDQFYIQPELVYYGAGETGKDKKAKGRKGYDAIYGNDYISLPIYFKGYFSEAESEFFGLAGIRFSYLLKQKIQNPSKEVYTIEGEQYSYGVSANGKANSFDFGIGAGVGYSYRRKLEIGLRYDVGLSNTYPGLMTESGNDPSIQKKKSQQVASLLINYIFD